MHKRFQFILLLSSASLAFACSEDDGDTGSEKQADESEQTAPFGSDADVMMASDLWDEISGYDAWDLQGDATGLVAGGAPHGAFVRIFQNDVVTDADFPEGSILVKENFGEDDESTLGALTVMKKLADYSPEGGDWFYAKYLPDGSLDVNPDGVALAGEVGKGASSGCIPCHQGAPGGDFVFGE